MPASPGCTEELKPGSVLWLRAAVGTLFSILWRLPLIRHLEATIPWEISFSIASKGQFSSSQGPIPEGHQELR